MLYSKGLVWRSGVVLLQPQGQEVPERGQAEQGGHVRVLEGDGDGQAGDDWGRVAEGRGEESARFLRREAAEGDQDELDHA